MIKDIFESVMKYLIWALATYFLAKFFGKMFLYFFAFIKSGIFSTPMQMLLGAAGGLLSITMMTIGALGIAGGISKLICVHLFKFESLKNDSFAIPDFAEIFKQTPEEKRMQEKRERDEEKREREKISEVKNSDVFREYERISDKIDNLKMQQGGFGSGLFDMFDSPDEMERARRENERLEEKIRKLEQERYWLREKIVDIGGRDLLREYPIFTKNFS